MATTPRTTEVKLKGGGTATLAVLPANLLTLDLQTMLADPAAPGNDRSRAYIRAVRTSLALAGVSGAAQDAALSRMDGDDEAEVQAVCAAMFRMGGDEGREDVAADAAGAGAGVVDAAVGDRGGSAGGAPRRR